MSSIGSSIFLGAASTFLGVLCLSLSTSDILQDIFKAVVGLIIFGVLNGLIFLPVALARLGPEEIRIASVSIDSPGDPSQPEPKSEEPSLLAAVSPISAASPEYTA